MFSHDASADVTGFDLRCIRFGHLQYIAERIGEHGSLQKKSFGSVNIARNISSEHFATRGVTGCMSNNGMHNISLHR